MDKKCIGVDIGGTKISVCIGEKSGKVYASKRIATASVSGWQEGIRAICSMAFDLLKDLDLSSKDIGGMGISAPGPVSVKEGKLLTPPNLSGWENAPVKDALKRALPYPVSFNNDANAQALAEYYFGEYKGTKELTYLTCSTGMGAGIITQGRLLQGASDTGGEVGHFVLDIQGPLCPCKQSGCFEMYCGGANFRRRVQEALQRSSRPSRILEEAGGKIADVDLIHIERALLQKDPLAEEMWEEFTTRLAQGIGTILMILNPEVVLLGTIAQHMKDLLLPKLEEKLPRYSWSMPRKAAKIAVSSLGEKISELAGIALAKSLDFGKKHA